MHISISPQLKISPWADKVTEVEVSLMFRLCWCFHDVGNWSLPCYDGGLDKSLIFTLWLYFIDVCTWGRPGYNGSCECCDELYIVDVSLIFELETYQGYKW